LRPGPCGIFAAPILAQMGFRPIILERGKVVRERTKDIWGLWRKRELASRAYVLGGRNYNAPWQLLGDFIAGTPSRVFGWGFQLK